MNAAAAADDDDDDDDDDADDDADDDDADYIVQNSIDVCDCMMDVKATPRSQMMLVPWNR